MGGQDSLAEVAGTDEHPFTWAFRWDSEPADIVAADMAASADAYMIAPGTVATEAASITVPVLVAVGERDVVPTPWLEPSAYKSSPDIGVFVCP